VGRVAPRAGVVLVRGGRQGDRQERDRDQDREKLPRHAGGTKGPGRNTSREGVCGTPSEAAADAEAEGLKVVGRAELLGLPDVAAVEALHGGLLVGELPALVVHVLEEGASAPRAGAGHEGRVASEDAKPFRQAGLRPRCLPAPPSLIPSSGVAQSSKSRGRLAPHLPLRKCTLWRRKSRSKCPRRSRRTWRRAASAWTPRPVSISTSPSATWWRSSARSPPRPLSGAPTPTTRGRASSAWTASSATTRAWASATRSGSGRSRSTRPTASPSPP